MKNQESMKKNKRNILIIVLILSAVTALLLLQHFVWSKEARSGRWLKEADAAFARGEYAEAGGLYDLALEIDPGDTAVMEKRIKAALEARELDAAKRCLDVLEKSKGDSSEYRGYLYRYAILKQDYALAASLLPNLPDYKPEPEEFFEIVSGLYDGAYYSQAEKILEAARRMYPMSEKFDEISLKVYVKLNDQAKALEAYGELTPDLAVDELNYLSDALLAEGKTDEAVKLLEASLRKDLRQKTIVKTLMNTLADKGDTENYWFWRALLLKNDISLPSLNINIFGNSAANIRQRGFLAAQGGRLYYADPEGGGIYCIGRFSGEAKKISRAAASNLNVRGDHLYFKDGSDGLLKKISAVDETLDVLSDKPVKSPLVWGEKIYYINLGDSQKLYVCDTDGQNHREVSTISISEFALSGRYVYFIGASDGNLHRVPAAGGRSEVILFGEFSDINVDEFSRIYLLDKKEGGIVTCEEDGSMKRLIHECEAEFLNYADGWLYFIQWTPYRIGTNGQELKSLASNFASELTILDDWVYSYAESEKSGEDTEGIYRFRPDGTDWNLLTFEQRTNDGR